jgi:hypothetical protein
MKLSDIMSHAGLSVYAQIALVLFLLAFLLVAIRLFVPSQQAALRAAGRLPLDDPNDRLAGLRRAADRPE